MLATNALSRLPALHPYSNGSNNEACSGDKTFKFTLQESVESVQGLASSEAEHRLISSLATFIAQLVGCDADEVLFKLNIGARKPCIASADGVQEQIVDGDSTSPPGIAICFLSATSESFPTFKDNLTITVNYSLDGTKNGVELVLDFAQPVPGDVAQGIRTQFCCYVFDSTLYDSAAPLSILNPSPTTHVKKGTRLHHSFLDQAQSYPDRIAVQFLESIDQDGSAHFNSITYAQLRNAALALANKIRIAHSRAGKDHGQQVIVPMLMTASLELYISYLAILMAGFAFCPLPIDAPDARLASLLDQVDATVMLGAGNSESPPEWAPTSVEWINVTETSVEADHSEYSDDSRKEVVDERQQKCAYVLFTSGTMGTPKGVQISHYSASVSIAAHAAHLHPSLLQPSSATSQSTFKWFQFASTVFDPSVMEIFVTLSTGGTLCSAPRSLTLSDLETVVRLSGAGIMMATPSVATLLRPNRVPNLRVLWTMGESLNPMVIRNFAATNGRTWLANAYGPTEASVNCTLLQPFPADYRGSIIGAPLPSCSLAIVTERCNSDSTVNHLEAVPRGVTGELVIGGPHVGMGYLRMPEATEDAFTTLAPLGRVYRTRDRARLVWDRAGNPLIEILGRMNAEQVKLSGRRVELGEVDSVLQSSKLVRNVANVVWRPGSSHGQVSGSERLVCCLVLADSSTNGKDVEADCRVIAEAQLPPHMRPWKYIVRPSLPVTVSGKSDRKRLAQLVSELMSSSFQGDDSVSRGQHKQADFTDGTVAQALAEAICTVCQLETSSISMNVDLFQLGLDSLAAMRLLQLLRHNDLTASAAQHLDVAKVLRAGSCADLVRLLSTLGGTVADRSSENERSREHRDQEWSTTVGSFRDRCRDGVLSALSSQDMRVRVKDILPTTATQSGMLTSFLTRAASSGSKRPYISHMVYHMATESEASKFYNALRQVTQRHDIYRTVFVPVDDKLAPFAQCLLSPGSDEGNVSKHFSKTTLGACLEKHLERVEDGMKLDQPPWHLGLLLPNPDSGDGESLVALSMMHAIFDGGSLDLLQQEAAALFHTHSCNPSPSFIRTELTSAVQHHFTSDLEESRRFWREKLDGVGKTRFPCVNGYKATVQSDLSSGSGVTEMLSRSSMLEVVKQARCRHTTVLVLLQTAWNLLLAAYAEDEDVDYVVSGGVHSGRLDEDTRMCMGPTFNVIPFITCLGKEAGDGRIKSVTQVLAEANAASTVALNHLEIPLGALANAGSMPFDTLFAVQRFDASTSCGQQHDSAAPPWTSVSYPVMVNDFAAMVEVWPASEAEQGLRLRLTYSQSVLDAPSAQLLLQQYDDILHRLMRDPDSTTVQQIINGEGLRSTALSISQSVESRDSDTKEALLHTQFESKALEDPDAIALEFFSRLDALDDGSSTVQRWTYGKLNARANRLAQLLLSITGRATLRDQPIPICMERCIELCVAALAILKAGGAWCPIDVQSPRARQLELIARTRSPIILVSPATSASLGIVQAEGQPLIVQVDACDASMSSQFSSENLVPTAAPESLAYLIWTSGTTGAPKGVMIEHSSAVASMQALQHHVRPPQQDVPPRCLQFSAYTFDVFVQDLFWTWGLGGTVVAATRELMLGSTAELVEASQATHAHLTPGFAAGLPRASCPSLRSVTFIGEKLTESVAADWTGNHHHDGKQLAPVAVYNTYGPAEVTVVATLRRIDADDRLQSANVGVPMRSVSAFVCRDREQPMRVCGKGSVGELVLAGAQVGRGYLDDTNKTQAVFKLSMEWQQRLYYTGDYVRMLHDGSIEFIGRRDDLVKLGGIRVELSEISAAIVSVQKRRGGAMAERAETVMLSRPDRPSKQVISFLACPELASTAHAGECEAVSASVLLTSSEAIELAQRTMQDVREVLPPYMVPSMILVLSHIPQTASAKIDRAKLQAAYASADLAQRPLASFPSVDPHSAAVESDEAYATLQERLIAAISAITGTQTFDINGASSLASIGLDSIRIIRLAAKLKQEGFKVPVSTLLACSTMRMLVIELVKHTGQEGEATREDVRSQLLSTKLNEFDQYVRKLLPKRLQEDLEACFSCSGLQEGMLTETLADPLAYWSDHVVRLDANIDLNRFARAWERTVDSIDMLRTVFAVVSQSEDLEGPISFDGELDVFALQMLYKSAPTSCIDVSSPDTLPSKDELHRAVSDWIRFVALDRAGVGLAQRPLWAVKTFKVVHSGVGSVTYAAMCIHHALYDGPSIEIILDRVQAEYTALGSKATSSLPSLTSLSTQCKYAFACTAEEQKESIRHWEEQLQARGSAALLPDLTSARSSSKKTAAARFVAASRSFRYAASRPVGVGVSTLIKTAFAMVLGQYVESEDQRHIVLGEVLSLRNLHTSLSTEKGAVGPLLTTLPFSLLLAAGSAHESPVSFLASGAVAHPLLKHRFASLGALAKIMGTRSDQEMFTAMYVYHQRRHAGESREDESRWAVVEERSSEVRVEHSTVLNVFEQGEMDDDDLLLELSMKEDRNSKDMLEVLLDQVVTLLNFMTSHRDETWQNLLLKVGLSGDTLSSINTIPRGSCLMGDLSTVYQGHDPLYWLEHHVRAHPSWPAVIVADSTSGNGSIHDASLSTYTYAELNDKANQVSALFSSLDLPANGPIALCMKRSLISLAITVAIFKSGRTYLPIDDQLPAERKRLLITDSHCALVVTEGQCLSDVEDDCRCLVLNVSDYTFEQRLSNINASSGQASSTAFKEAKATDGAYLLYTSGSTGKPKGVLVGRANLCSFIESYAEVVSSECPASLQLGGTGRYLGLAGRAFDVHLSQMFMSWRFGMALATGERSLLLGDLKATIQKLSITHMSCVPSLLDHCDLIAGEVPSLVFLGVGGEKLADRVRDTLASALTVLNAYGPTETTIMCTVNRVHPDSHVRDIRHVLPGNTAVVIDFDDKDRLSPVLRGRAGELCIRGDLVALGYHSLDPSQKASSGFVTLPDGCRMYRTGDAVRMMADGRLHYLGRRDEQEKIRGQRLELGEVSQCAIAGGDGGVHATTLILQHQSLAKPLLITLIAPKSGTSATQRRGSLPQILAGHSEMDRVARQIHQYCRQHLPSYMVPDLVIAVSHLTQLAASGKTDMRRLKAWLASADPSQLFHLQNSGNATSDKGLSVHSERPLTALEAKIARAVGQTLPKCPDGIRPSTSIFDLGIDSLSVIRLASQLRKVGLIVPIARLRMRPRIHEIASEASASAKGSAEDRFAEVDLSIGRSALAAFRARHYESLQAVRSVKLQDVLPCLPSQEGMVALSLSSSSSSDPVYIARMLVNVDVDHLGEAHCSAESLERAWMRLTQQHSILRTCFDHVDDDKIAQAVLNHVDIERHMVRPTLGQNETSTAVGILQDITTVPPWRIEIDEGTTSLSTFVLHMHHALYDGHSLALLLDDLTRTLRDEEEGTSDERPGIEQLLESILVVPAQRAQTFWCGTFANFPVNEPSIWSRFDRVSSQDMIRCKASLQLSPLEAAAKKLQVTLSSLVAAALGIAISRSFGTTAFTLGIVLWGRSLDLLSAEKIVAPCLTTVPMPFLLCSDRGAQGVGDVIRACYDWNSSCLAVQHMSMRQIRRWIGSERQGSLVDLLFSFVQSSGADSDQTTRGWRLDRVEAETDAPAAVEVTVDAAKYELRISAMAKHILPQNGLEGVVETLGMLLGKIASGTGADMDLKAAGVPTMSSASSKSRANVESNDPARQMTKVEEQIRNLAMEMCGAPSADLLQLNTPFLRIGLDSIVALRFSARLRKECGLQVSAHDVLAAGSIAGISRMLDKRQTKTNAADHAWSLPAEVPVRYKATPLQAGMLNGTIASPSHDLYVHHHAVLLKAAQDYDRLQRALQRVVAAHDILRTTFHLDGVSDTQGSAQRPLSWCAKITPFDALPILPQLSHHHSEKSSSRALQEYGADFCFDHPEQFGVSPWRAVVLHCASEKDVLVISMHHSLYDGVSLPSLFADLRAAYHNEAKELTVRPPFSLAADLIASTAEQSEHYWQQTLASFDRPCLLVQASAQAAAAATSMSYRLDELRISISAADLKRLSGELGATPQAVALLSWSKVLAVSSGQRDVCFGQVVSGRYLSLPGIEDVSGPLINTVPMRVNLVDDLSSNAATARELQERIVAAQPFQHASLGRIQNAWRREHGTQKPLFDSLFVFHNVQGKSQGRSDTEAGLWTGLESPESSVGLAEGVSKGATTAASEYPVNVSVIQDDDGLQVKAGASDAVGGAEWLPSMLQLFGQVFLNLLYRPHRPVGAFPEALAALPLIVSVEGCQQGDATSFQIGDGRRSLTGKEQAIVLRHMARRMKVDETTVKTCPNLFLLGIDSLLAICISADARSDNVALTPFDVLSAGSFARLTVADDKVDDSTTGTTPPSVEQETVELVGREAKQEALALLGISATDAEAVLPVLPGQKQHIDLWLERGRRFLEPTFVYAVEGKLQVDMLVSAWNELRRRHAALRTAFVRLKDTRVLVQVVLSERSSVWRDLEHSQLSLVDGGVDLDSAAFEAVKRLNASPTDLSRPSGRLTLVQGKQKDIVLLTVHHTSYDAWSMRLMAGELTELYHKIETNSLYSMRTPVSYTRFVEQTCRDALRAKEATKAFWGKVLRDASPTLVCRGVPQSIDQTMHVRKAAFKQADVLDARCHAHGFGLQVVVILAYARLLSFTAGHQELKSPTFGFYTAGRSAAFDGLGELIASTTAMQPMTVAVGAEGAQDLIEELRAIQKKLVHRANHQQDDVSCPVAFDAHLNLLWHKPNVRERHEAETGAKTELLKPYKLPYDSGYFTSHPLMPGKTSVDVDPSEARADSTGRAQLYMDVGLDARTGTLSLGARCDRSAMDSHQLEAFCDQFVVEMEKLSGIL